ncbi:hypothetical protein Pan97_07260 [Bremerella volcania]|uniref:Uncharacterized protein n=1 Tax=Bremerella volcania TaxID=2527984 RepID=A0A518C3C7_9BACT|nr:hypothetical protein Pan97_07260 [Bremerella volcania]
MSSSCECCKAMWIKFRLDAPLTSGDEKVKAKIYIDKSGFRHFWQGQDPDPDDEGFDVFNLEAPDWATTTGGPSTTSDPHQTFQFSGSPGEIGLACLDDSFADKTDSAEATSCYRIVELGTRDPDRVKIRNGGCQTLSSFSILGIDDSAIDPSLPGSAFERQIVLDGVVPTNDHKSRFAILGETIPQCEAGLAVVSGTTQVKVYINDETHQYADIAVGETSYLTSAESGSAQILWRESGMGLKWAIVRLSNVSDLKDEDDSTPTTSAPGGGSPPSPQCTGNAKWRWSADSASWSLEENNCGTEVTTTTSSPTPSSTTPAPPAPPAPTCCPWQTAETTTSTTSTTEDPGNTTTTAAPCQPLYPEFCGSEDGECTFTYCSDRMNTEPKCDHLLPTTTTSFDPNTTTPDPGSGGTTCDCNTTTTTTTTPEPECSKGCKWKWLPSGGGWRWVKMEDGCTSKCPCPYPDEPGENKCATAHTACKVTTTTTTLPPANPCTGVCNYTWVPDFEFWNLTDSNCSGGTGGCGCVPPSSPGGTDCDTARVLCGGYDDDYPENTTTPAPGSCEACYTSSTTSTTSTTPEPCDSFCKYQWSTVSESWSVIEDNCVSDCPCGSPPSYAGQDDCETVAVSCDKYTTTTSTSTTTSTTTSSTTSTTTSTTTTTTPSPSCNYICVNTGGSYNWIPNGQLSCECCIPTSDCSAATIGAISDGGSCIDEFEDGGPTGFCDECAWECTNEGAGWFWHSRVSNCGSLPWGHSACCDPSTLSETNWCDGPEDAGWIVVPCLDSCPTTTLVPTTTTTPGPTTTTPGPTSTTPGLTSTTPGATSTTAGVTSTTPGLTTTTQALTSTTPDCSSGLGTATLVWDGSNWQVAENNCCPGASPNTVQGIGPGSYVGQQMTTTCLGEAP